MTLATLPNDIRLEPAFRFRTLLCAGLSALFCNVACGSGDEGAQQVALESGDALAPPYDVSGGSGLGGSATAGSDPGPSGAEGAELSDDASGGAGAPVADGNGDPAQSVEPGTLTAGAWDDNRNLEHFLQYRAELHDSPMSGLLDFSEADHAAAADAVTLAARATLDVALVIDTTGSMGDELAYLQAEFEALSQAIEAEYPNAEQRWALVVYRDDGDDYVSRSFDFQASAAAFRDSLEAQSSAGGGDYPEASHAALAAMNQLSWRAGDDTARLAFWVADAPHHERHAAELTSAIRVAQDQDIHLYPVASSGVDELTELSMRSAAQLTLGRYIFLTDDSGVGGEHKEPTIPCYFVTRLDSAILRMVDIEMSGAYREPEVSEVIRAGGNPADGACVLESGQTVFAF